jgi:hypothetical protein
MELNPGAAANLCPINLLVWLAFFTFSLSANPLAISLLLCPSKYFCSPHIDLHAHSVWKAARREEDKTEARSSIWTVCSGFAEALVLFSPPPGVFRPRFPWPAPEDEPLMYENSLSIFAITLGRIECKKTGINGGTHPPDDEVDGMMTNTCVARRLH